MKGTKHRRAPNIGIHVIIGLFLVAFSAAAQQRLEPVPTGYSILEQHDSPVRIAYVGIYPSPSENKMISYSVTNLGNRDIRSMIVRYTRGGVTESIFLGLPSSPDVIGSAPFMPAGVSSQFVFLYREPATVNNEKSSTKLEDSLTLQTDYVLFRDGSSWGPNLGGMAANLLGIFDGQKRFAAEAKKLVDAKDEAALRTLIMTDGPPPDLRSVEGESQRKAGIRRGYSVGMFALRSDFLGRGDLSGIPARIRDIESEVGIEPHLNDNRKQVSVSWGFGLPIQITGLVVGSRNVAIDERFSGEGDWLSEMSLKIQNKSGKPLKALVGSMMFPETRGNGGMRSSSFRYGPNPAIKRPTLMDSDPLISPDESFAVKIFREQPGTMFLLKDYPGLVGITRAVIGIDYIDFEDGTRWSGGQLHKPDPENPGRWIPVKQ